jgi:hypothetical protein
MSTESTTDLDAYLLLLAENARLRSMIHPLIGFVDAAPTLDFNEDRSLSWVTIMVAHARAVLDTPTPDPWLPVEGLSPTDGMEILAYNGEICRMVFADLPAEHGGPMWLYAEELMSSADPAPVQPTHYQFMSPPVFVTGSDRVLT